MHRTAFADRHAPQCQVQAKCVRTAVALWWPSHLKTSITPLLNANLPLISFNYEAQSIMMEPLPAYVEDQVPQNAFDALLTRISLPIDVTLPRHPNARVVLESYVESQKAPAYNVDDAANVQSPSPISEYPADPDSINVVAPDPILLRVKQRIVEEFFRAIEREEDESVALLIQNNLVTANTTNRAGGTPLLAAISANVMPIVKQLLDLGADPNAFGQVVSILSNPFAPLIIAFIIVGFGPRRRSAPHWGIDPYAIDACCQPRVAPHREAAV